MFQGFQNYFVAGFDGPGSRNSKALDTIERLDLWNESAGWQMFEVPLVTTTADIENIKEIKPKGCFTMFNMADFDVKALEKTQDKAKEKAASDQIIETPVLKKVNETVKFKKNADKYALKDKIILFGGWQPYRNLDQIEVFDAKKNAVEDVLPLAHNIRGRPCEAKRSIL